jgi:hypothetical protein
MEIPRSLFTSVQMTPERWQQVKAILADAIERDDAIQRAAFVESSCAGDLLLKQEVEALLAYAGKSDGDR